MTTAAQLMVKVGADISGLQRGLAQADSSIQGAAKRMGASAAAVGRTLTMGLTLPLVGVGVAATKMASDFDKEMRNIQSISKQSDAAIAELGREIREMSMDMTQTTDSAVNLAAGFYDIQSSGFAGADAMQVLRAATKAASAGLTTTDVAAQGITATLNAYSMNADQASYVSDVLFRTVDIGVVTFEELASQLGDIVSVGATANVSIEELGAAMATLTKAGISAPEAATGIKQLMLSFISPSTEAAKVAKALGIEFDAQAVAAKGLYGVMEDVQQATGGNVEIMAALFPNVRALNAALALTRGEMQPFAQDMQAIGNAAGATAQAFAIQSKSFDAQMKNFKNTMNGLLIDLGTQLLPILTEVVNALRPMIKAFGELPEPVKKAIVVVGMIAAVLGPVLMIAGPIISAIGSIGGAIGGLVPLLSGVAGAIVAAVSAIGAPILAVVALIAAAVLAFKTNFLGFRDYLTQLWEAVKAIFGFLKDTIGAFWRFITGEISWSQFTEIVGQAFENLKARLVEILNAIKQIFVNAWNDIVDFVMGAISKIGGALGGLMGWIKGGLKGNPFKAMGDGARAAAGDMRQATAAVQGTTAAVRQLQSTASQPLGLAAWGAMGRPIGPQLPDGVSIANSMDMLSLEDLLGESIANGAASGIDAMQQAWESAVSNMVGNAKSALERLAPEGFFQDMQAPGANGPFENIFRALDVAVHGDASQWADKLGLDQATAAQIVRDFQAGLITDQVKALIDVPMLTGMIQKQQLGQAMTQAFVADVAKAAGASKGAVIKALLPTQSATGGVAQPIIDSAASVSTGLTTSLATSPNPETLQTGGLGMVTNLATGITDNVQLMVDAADAMVRAFMDKVSSFGQSLYDQGYWIGQRLADGLYGATEILTRAAEDVVLAMLKAMKKAIENSTTAPPPPPTPPGPNGQPTGPTAPTGQPTGVPGGGRSVTVNVYNPTGTPTEQTVMSTLKNLAAVGIMQPV